MANRTTTACNADGMEPKENPASAGFSFIRLTQAGTARHRGRFSTGSAHPADRQDNTPTCLPMRVKASMALSRCPRVCAALICVRIRAWPLGTTGKKKPVT